MTAIPTVDRTALERFEAEFPNSRRLYEEARAVFPAGVTHDSRFLEPFPVYVERAEGSRRGQGLVPSAERVRFTSSGTEATLMALRLARLHTGQPRVLKFAGHFHGWNDFVVPASGSPSELEPVPGVLDEIHTNTVVIPPN